MSLVCRSTKSEKTYPSMFSRMAATDIETEPYYCLPVNGGNGAAWSSQPTSPTPRNLTGLIISPTHSNSPHRLIYHGKKNDEGTKFEINSHSFLINFSASHFSSWQSNIFNVWWFVNVWIMHRRTTSSKRSEAFKA